jgi:hypothetical protein
MPTAPEASQPLTAAERQALLHDDLIMEYYKISDIVTGFDQRLLTIKGWGVTFSLATTALAFQQNHYGLFLVAAASALAFWIVEGSIKLQQMRYYPRMGDIESAAFDLYRQEEASGAVSSPLIDWSWHTAWARIRGGEPKGDPRVPVRWKDVSEKPGGSPYLFLHVAFPHLIVVTIGVIFFGLGLGRILGPL